MNKTILYKEVDGYKIIVGFDQPTIDPVATAVIVNEKIKETSEWIALEAKKSEYAQACKDKADASASKDDPKYKSALATMSVRQDEMKPLASDLAEKIISLRNEHAVYFETRPGEVIKDASEVESLAAAIKDSKENELIALDGSTIQNNRGAIFYRKSGGKWGRTHIVKLGDKIPGGAILEADVTDTQRDEINKDRVTALSVPERAAEKAMAMDEAMLSASAMRGELEIKSDPDALTKTQDSYNAEVARIEALYG